MARLPTRLTLAVRRAGGNAGRGGDVMVSTSAPDGIPVLSRGKHRSARRGACFMEMASVLAGEPWSDAPKCTHPLLAHLARLVNDASTDAHRSELAVLIPDVVGVRDDSLAFEV